MEEGQGFILEFHLGREAHGSCGLDHVAVRLWEGRVQEGDVSPPARSVKPKNASTCT